MPAITLDSKMMRRKLTKNARRRSSGNKVIARRQYRSRMKASDRATDFEGYVSPALTGSLVAHKFLLNVHPPKNS